MQDLIHQEMYRMLLNDNSKYPFKGVKEVKQAPTEESLDLEYF